MAAQNLNIEVVMETANKVIENHSKLQELRQLQLDEPLETEEKEEDEHQEENTDDRLEEEESTSEQSFSSERMVKSHSEAPIGSSRGQYTSH